MEKGHNGSDSVANETSEGSEESREGIDPAKFFGEAGDEYARNADGSVKLRSDGKPAKKPGRKAGDGKSKSKTRTIRSTPQPGAIETVASALAGIHWIAAAAFDAREFQMSDEQAKRIAKSVDRVLRAYEVPRNEKVESVVELSAVLGTHYLTAAINYNSRKKLEAAEKRRQAEQAREDANKVMVFKPADKAPGGPGAQ